MEKSGIGTLIIVATFILCGCGGGRTIIINKSKLPDTYHCEYMEEVCKEAREFESKWYKMTPEEKKESKEVLRTYRQQCNDALDACMKSGKKKE
ncbi:MAG: hypothetical protein N2053_05240 [Chitinispirillaceae bacterium]|nr:hypothetical protein [Chitinispirillaceae bacterium]